MFLKLRNDRLLKNAPVTYLSEMVTAGELSLNVLSNAKFSGTNFFLLMEGFGGENAEIVEFSGTSGSDTLICSSLKFDHPQNAPVYLIKADTVVFYYAASETAAYASIPSGTPAVDCVDIDTEEAFTVFEDVTHSSGYGKAAFYNSVANSQYGSFYEIAGYTGDDRLTRGFVKRLALDRMNAVSDAYDLTEQFLDDVVTECDARLRDEKISWKEEVDQLMVETEIGVTEYDVSSYVKDDKTISSILGAYYGTDEIEMVTRDNFYTRVGSAVSSKLTAPITVAGATIAMESTANFLDAGTIFVGGYSLSYSTNDRASNTLTGIVGLTEDISETSAKGATFEVWQGAEIGTPDTATIIGGKLLTYPLVEADPKLFKLDYTRTFSPITSDSDELAFPSFLYIDFLKSAIAEKRGDKDAERKEQRYDRNVIKHKAKDISAVDNRFRPGQQIYSSSRRQR